MTANGNLPLGPEYDPNAETLDEYLDNLYNVFLNDVVDHPIAWKNKGQTLSIRRHPEIDGRHAIFWHIISGGPGSESTRNVEIQRCIRLSWLRILIERFNADFPAEDSIQWWEDTKRSSSPRYVITRHQYDYIIVVEQRKEYALLITAYYVEHEHRRRKLKKEHDNYWGKARAAH